MAERDDLTEQEAEPEPTEATKREGQGSSRSGRKAAEPVQLERGSSVGRYVILGMLGEGGMGVVYSAFDPELDRKVAIKLLQATAEEGSMGGGQAWLLREAQAMARLSHPNVIAVHDVGTLDGDRVFVAMELVEGVTLRQWLKARPRTWREVLPVMLAAGAGLAAAHAAGLVHRDFKPDNVLVGDDGRVRVMDFGLARLRGDEEPSQRTRSSDLQIESRSPLSESLTIAGTVVGTPAYMAPEIYDGLGANAGSDQFAFGVALYEALYRVRPYEKRALVPPREPTLAPKQPPETGVPAAIQRVAMRAISIEPARRYPSMDALLAELAVDPTARRRRLLVAAAACVLVAGIGGGMYALSRSKDQLCKGADRRLAGVWDGPTKQVVAAAFAASKLPFAPHALAQIEKALDVYAKEWSATVVESCEATRIHGEQTEEVLSLRQDCLDQRLEELHAFTGLLAKADDDLIGKAENAAYGLEPVKKCSDVAALRSPLAATPEIRGKLAPVRVKLAAAKADMILGKFGGTINEATAAADAAKAIPFAPVEAEARLMLGLALMQVGNAADADTALAEATWSALRGRRDDIAGEAALWDAMLHAQGLNKPDEARTWLSLGGAIAARVGASNRPLELRRLEIEGVLLGESGDLVNAAKDHEQALALAKEIYHPDALIVTHNEQLLATTLTKSGAYLKALPHYEHALAQLSTAFGADHPDNAPVLLGLGICYAHVGKFDKARAAYDHALAIRQKAFGKNSPMLLTTLNNIGDMLAQQGDGVGALRYLERARAIGEKVPGPSHPIYHTLMTTYGEAQFAAGKIAEARDTLDAVIALEEKSKSPMLPATLTSRALVALAEKAWDQAEAFDRHAIEIYEANGGKEEPELWKPLTGLGRALIGSGRMADARAALERALALAQKVGVPDADLAPTRAALARVH